MNWNVIDVKSDAPTKTLHILFRDGTRGTVHFEESHLTGVFAALREDDIFSQVRLENGVVAWPGEIDLAPDAMYDEIRAHGKWILR